MFHSDERVVESFEAMINSLGNWLIHTLIRHTLVVGLAMMETPQSRGGGIKHSGIKIAINIEHVTQWRMDPHGDDKNANIHIIDAACIPL